MPNEPSSGDSASSEAAGFCILAIASLPVLDVVGATLVSSEPVSYTHLTLPTKA